MTRFLDFLIGVPLVYFLGFFRPHSSGDPAKINKILIIKLAAVGDTILLRTVLKSFRAAHPDATIHWLVSPINVGLAKDSPDVNRILVWSRGLLALLPLIRLIRSESYDVVCDLEQWSRGTALIAWMSGAPVRLGFDTPGQFRGRVFTQTHEKKYNQHEIDDFYDVLSLLTPIHHDHSLQLTPTAEGIDELNIKASFLAEKKLTVLIHPGCGTDGTPREWPIENYAVIAHLLKKQFSARIILTSGPEEMWKTIRLNRLLKGAAIDFGGKLTWSGLIAMVNAVDVVISGNTGVMHVAAALQKKQLALHGPTNPLIWGPLNPNAVVIQTTCPQCPCLKLGFEYHSKDQSCMRLIDISVVKPALLRLIDTVGTI